MIGELIITALVGKTIAEHCPAIDFDINKEDDGVSLDLDIGDFKEKKRQYEDLRTRYYVERHLRRTSRRKSYE